MRHTRALLTLFVLAAVVTTLASCGKKGPPLAPQVRLPARVADLTARRIGDTVYLTFTIPTANADKTTPADVSRVDVYAYTALHAQDISNVRDMVRLASIAVRRPPEPEEPPKPGEKPKPPKPPKPPEPGEDQGAVVTVTEALTPALETLSVPSGKPVVKPPVIEPRVWFDTPLTLPLAGVARVSGPVRFYTVVGVNHHGDRGAVAQYAGVRLAVTPPAAPGAPTLTVGEKAIVLTWTAPPGTPEPLQAPVAAAAATASAPVPATVPAGGSTAATVPAPAAPGGATPPSTPVQAPPVAGGTTPAASGQAPILPAGAIAPPAAAPVAAEPAPVLLTGTPRGMLLPVMPAYNVYAVDQPASSGNAGAPKAPKPLNGTLLTGLTYSDDKLEFGVERCYEVRAVNAVGALGVPAPSTSAAAAAAAPPAAWSESGPSPRVCVTPKDVFPPPVPTSLAAVASDGAINLIWQGVEAADVAGYLVLRGLDPDGPLTPLFEAPIRETTYRDTTVKAGVRYVYAVVSVDLATPANRSAPSTSARETAR